MITMAIRSVAVLLTLVGCNCAQRFTETCDFNPPCKQVSTIDVTISDYAKRSPYYEPVGINHGQDSKMETIGACVTLSQINNSTFLVFRNYRTKNGSTNLEIYLAVDIEGQPGAIRMQGIFSNTGNATSVLNAYIIGSGCETCSPFYLLYACYLLDTDAYVHPVDDFVFSAYTSPNPPTSCLDQYETLVGRLGLTPSAGFARASGCLPQCVTKYYNNTCFNADTVDPANAISFP